MMIFFFFQAEDGIRDYKVTGVQTCALPILAREVPGGRGLPAWDALLRAHATLLRQLETDLESKTGLALADFDVLAQLAIAGGSLRMAELAERALISRSGMTRRVTRLVHEGLVSRAHVGAD